MMTPTHGHISLASNTPDTVKRWGTFGGMSNIHIVVAQFNYFLAFMLTFLSRINEYDIGAADK